MQEVLTTEAESEQPLCWEIKLLPDQTSKRLVVVVCALGMFILGIWLFKSLLLGVFGLVAIFGSTAEIWCALKYRLDDDGASVRCGLSVTSIEWDKVKSIYRDAEGVKLSPLDRPGRLDAFRGVYLRFASNEQQVLATISANCNRYERILANGTD